MQTTSSVSYTLAMTHLPLTRGDAAAERGDRDGPSCTDSHRHNAIHTDSRPRYAKRDKEREKERGEKERARARARERERERERD